MCPDAPCWCRPALLIWASLTFHPLLCCNVRSSEQSSGHLICKLSNSMPELHSPSATRHASPALERNAGFRPRQFREEKPRKGCDFKAVAAYASRSTSAGILCRGSHAASGDEGYKRSTIGMPVASLMRFAKSGLGRRSPLRIRVMVDGSTPSSCASCAGLLPVCER